MQEIFLAPYACLAGVDPGEIVAFDVGADGFPYVVMATGPTDDRTVCKGGASFPKIRPETPQGYQIYRLRNRDTHLVATIEREAFNIHHVQPMGDDQFLLACARCRYRDTGADRNGRFYLGHGHLTGAMTLGDGIINDVAVTPDGLIWASYFDEGVFGNFGWSQPLGASGLVAWRQDGSVAYSYQPPPQLDFICDCYAMNACGNEIGICCYTDFPLVQIRNGAVVGHWEVPVRGQTPLPFRKATPFSAGATINRETTIFWISPSQPPAGEPASGFGAKKASGFKAQRVSGRGDALFLLQNREIFRITVGRSEKGFDLNSAHEKQKRGVENHTAL